jgi:hypothetical protein
VSSSEGAVELDAEATVALPRALQRRVLEHAVGRVRDRSGGITAALDALGRPRGGVLRFAVASGIEIAVAADRIVVTREPEASQADTRMGGAAADGAAGTPADG